MAENNRDTESFALGLIVAAILYLLLRREFGKGRTTGMRASAGAGAVPGGCGCGGAAATKQPGQANSNTPLSIGNQSYNQPYASSSVIPVEWSSASGGSGASERVN